MKRLALVTLLLASSSLVAAPAPVPKPQRKAQRPAAQRSGILVFTDSIEEVAVPNFNVVGVAIGAIQPAQPGPAQPPNADPPG